MFLLNSYSPAGILRERRSLSCPLPLARSYPGQRTMQRASPRRPPSLCRLPPTGGGSLRACSKAPIPETPGIRGRPERHTICGGSITDRPQGESIEGASTQTLVGRTKTDHKKLERRRRKFRKYRKVMDHYPWCQEARSRDDAKANAKESASSGQPIPAPIGQSSNQNQGLGGSVMT